MNPRYGEMRAGYDFAPPSRENSLSRMARIDVAALPQALALWLWDWAVVTSPTSF
jgi:hypothetical protein